MSIFSSAIRLGYETERSLVAGSISGTYAQVGSSFANPIRILVLQNQTDVPVTFSLDGVRDTITLQSKQVETLNICTNRSDSAGSLSIPINMGVWVKATSPTTGSVYISAFYGAVSSTT